jgi:hypothetical protein
VQPNYEPYNHPMIGRGFAPVNRKRGISPTTNLIRGSSYHHPPRAPRQETGFLRQLLHPTREICSETRFLNPPRNQETGFLRQFLHPNREIGSETRFLAPFLAPRNKKPGFWLTLAADCRTYTRHGFPPQPLPHYGHLRAGKI